MAFEVKPDDEAAVVLVRVSGPAPHEEHLAARREAARICRMRGWPRMLVDLRDLETTAAVSTMSCFEFGSTYIEDDFMRACWIAYLSPIAEEARRDADFAATVGMNRGALVRRFETLEEARAWLRRNPLGSNEG